MQISVPWICKGGWGLLNRQNYVRQKPETTVRHYLLTRGGGGGGKNYWAKLMFTFDFSLSCSEDPRASLIHLPGLMYASRLNISSLSPDRPENWTHSFFPDCALLWFPSMHHNTHIWNQMPELCECKQVSSLTNPTKIKLWVIILF